MAIVVANQGTRCYNYPWHNHVGTHRKPQTKSGQTKSALNLGKGRRPKPQHPQAGKSTRMRLLSTQTEGPVVTRGAHSRTRVLAALQVQKLNRARPYPYSL